MPNVTHLRCILCSATYDRDEVRYTCPRCGDSGLLDVLYDYASPSLTKAFDALRDNRDRSIARYQELLPLAGSETPMPMQVGGTPLVFAPRLAERLGIKALWIKDDGRNPTGSLKDRASAVCVARATELKEPLITAASTGNAASSLSGLAASVQIPTVIFVPRTAPQAKVAQLLIYGARVIMVEGTYDDAFELCLWATKTFGWYSRNTGYNPYLLEGKKTVSLEIAKDLDWKAPDQVFVSMGDGCIMGGVWKGFHDLLQMQRIQSMPKMMGVQAQGSDVLCTALESDAEPRAIQADTIADSISVGMPRAASQALRGIRDSRGGGLRVSDQEILDAMRILARDTGIFAEPAGSAAIAGLITAARDGRIGADERVVAIVTGNGLKDVAGAMKAVDAQPVMMAPDPAALQAEVEKWGLTPAARGR